MPPTAEYVRGLLTYDPGTGLFVWKVERSNVHVGQLAGSLDGRGYITISIDNKMQAAHRLAFVLMEGEWPDAHVDHINGVRHDNRWENLRVLPQSGNNQNNDPAVPRGKSGYMGVVAHGRRWQAQIGVDSRKHTIGTFDTVEQASAAYLLAKAELHPSWERGRAASTPDEVNEAQG